MKVLWSFSGLVPFMKEPLVWACSFLGYLGQFSKLFLQIDEHLLRETSDSGSRFSHIKKDKKERERDIYIYVYFHTARRADIIDGNNFHGQGQRSLMPAFLAASWVADPFLGPFLGCFGKAARKKQGGDQMSSAMELW